ncbi:hypothetical protein OS493_018348 [Desmophyllum pertusum]|uniref:Uncharacterized protein n=1 Tax=Desmophyllum pertusum TaxID=174260 RepID=A0A9W9YFI7_9CNID|nr:hypothetical protein OS493_018348 [Desmophyllum pertusum]
MSMTPAAVRFEAQILDACGVGGMCVSLCIHANSPATRETAHNTLVKACCLEGENIISVWVHNTMCKEKSTANFKTQLGGSAKKDLDSSNPYHVGLSEFFPCWLFNDKLRLRGFRARSVSSRRDGAALGPGIGETRQARIKSSFITNMCGKTSGKSVSASNDSNTKKEHVMRIMSSSQPGKLMPSVVHDNQIHDFGIVDFLKAQPYRSKGYEDLQPSNSRVSTVSPLTLSPKNPSKFSLVRSYSDDGFPCAKIPALTRPH